MQSIIALEKNTQLGKNTKYGFYQNASKINKEGINFVPIKASFHLNYSMSNYPNC